MPKQIQQGVVGQKLVRSFNLKGRFQPLLDEVIVPVYEVNPNAVEVRRAVAFKNQGAVAAEYSYATILNPPGSSLLMRVTKIIVQDTTASSIVYGVASGTLGTTAMQKAWRDQRHPGLPAATVGVGTTPTGVAATANWRWIAAGGGNTQLITDMDVWFEAGGGLTIQSGTVNHAMAVTFEWEEEEIIQP